MKKSTLFAAMVISVLLAGCMTPPQQPVALSKSALQDGATRIGVAMQVPQKPDTAFPGADCLLCLAAASMANNALTDHTRTLPLDDLTRMKSDVAEVLRKKGHAVTVIEESIKFADLPKSQGGPNKSPVDFSSLRTKYGIDKLVMINIAQAGITRAYAAYIPTSDPQGVIAGTGYMVNLADNTYEWYLPLRHVKSAAGKWDEAPNFPGLSNAYFQAVEATRDAVLQPLSE